MRFKIALYASLFFAGSFAFAQDHVNAGAVLKYTGLPSNIEELKTTNLYLRTLESQVAGEVLHLNGVRYIDRVSVDQIFRELNLSEDAVFNSSSGALRGLLGRLDLLIVLDANDGSLARLRLIDLEDGSVRAVATCKRSYFSGASDGALDCVKGFVANMAPVTREVAATKSQRKLDAGRRAQQASEDSRKAEAARDARQAVAAHQAASERRAAETKAQAQQEADRARQEANEKLLAEKHAAVAALQPQLDDDLARLQSADGFWGRMQQTLASQGRSLRYEVQSNLRAADAAGVRCTVLAKSLEAPGLNSCIGELSAKLDVLENYK